MTTPIDVVVVKCRKICRTENRWNRALLAWQKNKQNFGFFSNCRYCVDRAKNLPWLVVDIWLTLFQISPKSVYFRRSYSRTRQHRSFAPYSISIFAFVRIIREFGFSTVRSACWSLACSIVLSRQKRLKRSRYRLRPGHLLHISDRFEANTLLCSFDTKQTSSSWMIFIFETFICNQNHYMSWCS